MDEACVVNCGCDAEIGRVAPDSPETPKARCVEMRRGRAVKLPHSAGAMLECIAGLLWVVQGTARSDRMLGPGERLRMCKGGDVHIVAFHASRLRLTETEAARGEAWWKKLAW